LINNGELVQMRNKIGSDENPFISKDIKYDINYKNITDKKD